MNIVQRATFTPDADLDVTAPVGTPDLEPKPVVFSLRWAAASQEVVGATESSSPALVAVAM